jgi:hypothetical protein
MNITRLIVYAATTIGLTSIVALAHPASDVAPGTLDTSTSPPTYHVVGDGNVGIADVVVLLRASVGLHRIVHDVPSEAGFVAGDVAPGIIDETVDPPLVEVVGDGAITIGDVIVLLRNAVGLNALSHPAILWEPRSIDVPGIPGQSATTHVTATFRSDTPATTVWITPSLSDYITVEPASLGPQAAGSEVMFTIHSNLPVGSDVSHRGGTLHLRDGHRTIARPLNVNLQPWPSRQLEMPRVPLTYRVPPGWTVLEDSLGAILLPVADGDVTEGVPAIAIVIHDNPTRAFLPEFLAAHNEGWYILHYRMSHILVDGRDSLLAEVETPPRRPELSAFIPGDDYVVELMSDRAFEAEFQSVLFSLDLP